MQHNGCLEVHLPTLYTSTDWSDFVVCLANTHSLANIRQSIEPFLPRPPPLPPSPSSLLSSSLVLCVWSYSPIHSVSTRQWHLSTVIAVETAEHYTTDRPPAGSIMQRYLCARKAEIEMLVTYYTHTASAILFNLVSVDCEDIGHTHTHPLSNYPVVCTNLATNK